MSLRCDFLRYRSSDQFMHASLKHWRETRASSCTIPSLSSWPIPIVCSGKTVRASWVLDAPQISFVNVTGSLHRGAGILYRILQDQGSGGFISAPQDSRVGRVYPILAQAT